MLDNRIIVFHTCFLLRFRLIVISEMIPLASNNSCIDFEKTLELVKITFSYPYPLHRYYIGC